jgi:hypothetical protein
MVLPAVDWWQLVQELYIWPPCLNAQDTPLGEAVKKKKRGYTVCSSGYAATDTS